MLCSAQSQDRMCMHGTTLSVAISSIISISTGDKIHATVRRTLIYKFQRDLKEGSVYSISNLTAGSPVGSYLTTRHSYKFNFQFGTKVKLADNGAIPTNIFTLTPPPEVFRNDFNRDYLVDVMGMLCTFGTEKPIDRDGLKTKMIDMELNSDGYRFNCTLFGPYVDELLSFVASGETNNAVVVVLFAKVKIFQGKPVLQNSMFATKLLFNPDVSVAVDLRKRMTANSDSPYQVTSQVQDSSRVSLFEDLLTSTPRATIKCLKDCKEAATFVVLGTVEKLLDEDEWWYTACTCHKKVIPDEKYYYCDKCNKHVLKVTPRYRIKVCVKDETAAATFVIFDRDASLLFHKSCVEMLESIDMDCPSSAVPKVISDLVDQTFVFKVDVEKEMVPRFEKSFSVKKLYSDPEILQKIKESKSPEGAVAGSSGLQGSNNSSPTPAPNISFAQDLMSKFSESMTGSRSAAKGKEAIVLCSNNDECSLLKRSSPEADLELSTSAPAKLLKSEIKIEKN